MSILQTAKEVNMAPPDRFESRTEAWWSVWDGSPAPSADTQKGECM